VAHSGAHGSGLFLHVALIRLPHSVHNTTFIPPLIPPLPPSCLCLVEAPARPRGRSTQNEWKWPYKSASSFLSQPVLPLTRLLRLDMFTDIFNRLVSQVFLTGGACFVPLIPSFQDMPRKMCQHAVHRRRTQQRRERLH
jgi:hypothetical protein